MHQQTERSQTILFLLGVQSPVLDVFAPCFHFIGLFPKVPEEMSLIFCFEALTCEPSSLIK